MWNGVGLRIEEFTINSALGIQSVSMFILLTIKRLQVVDLRTEDAVLRGACVLSGTAVISV